MSKEEQGAAAQRIMTKLGAMDAQEQQTYDLLTRRPGDYIPPDPQSGERVCGICGEVFQGQPATRESPQITPLEQYADHMGSHNPTPGQWAEAHRRIQQARERRPTNEGN